MSLSTTALLPSAFSQENLSPANRGNVLTGRDEFLHLLSTQLQHQDPLNPLQNTEFVTQLAQFSSLEQLIQIREAIENLALVSSQASSPPAEK